MASETRGDPTTCEACGKLPAAFQIKHPETCVHWRCLGCFRDIVKSNVQPILVFGTRTKNGAAYTVNTYAAAMATSAAREAFVAHKDWKPHAATGGRDGE